MLDAAMRILSLLLMAACALLSGCKEPASPRYVNKQFLFSFIAPKGWTVTEERTSSCLVSVMAQSGDCRFYICVSERPEDFLPTTSDFANCELVKEYVSEKLKGFNVSCRPSLLQGRRTYDAIYLRRVADENGDIRLQLVRQTFLPRGRLLYTMTSYVFGKNEDDFKAAYSSCDNDILRSQATFFLHQPPPAEKP